MEKYKRKLYLVRHGQTYNNIEGLTYEYDSGLTDLGIKQAVEISNFFNENIQLIIHSGMNRTIETACFTKKRFPDAKILEWDVGEFDYLGEKDSIIINRERRKCDKDIFWKLANSYYKFNKQAESFNDFLRRIESFVHEAINCDTDTIVVFTHKYFLKGVLWNVMMKNRTNYHSVKEFYRFCDLYEVNNANIIPCLINENKIYFGAIKTI